MNWICRSSINRTSKQKEKKQNNRIRSRITPRVGIMTEKLLHNRRVKTSYSAGPGTWTKLDSKPRRCVELCKPAQQRRLSSYQDGPSRRQWPRESSKIQA